MFDHPCDCVHCIHCRAVKKRSAQRYVQHDNPFNKDVLMSLAHDGFHFSYTVDLQAVKPSVRFVVCAAEYAERSADRVEIYDHVYALVQKCLAGLRAGEAPEIEMPYAISGAALGKHDLFKTNKHLVQVAGVYEREHPENERYGFIGDRFPQHNSHSPLKFVGIYGVVLDVQLTDW